MADADEQPSEEPESPAAGEEATAPEGSEDNLEPQRAQDYLTDGGFLTQVVLIGASALIPIPFVDDLVAGYLERRLFASTAESENVVLSSAEVKALTSSSKGCCVKGCLSNAVLYPIKKLIRKLLFVLEIKRAIDQASDVLVRCWLFRCALSEEWWTPDGSNEDAAQMNQALRETCKQEGTSPFYHAVASVFRGAKGMLKNLGELLTGEAQQAGENEDEALTEDRVHKVEQAAGAESLAASLSSALGALPSDYLERLTTAFHRNLAAAKQAAVQGPAVPDQKEASL